MLNAVERLARGYGVERDRTRQDVELAETQLRDYQARVGQPFSHDGYLDQLAALRDQLKAGLSGAAPEAGTDEKPAVSDLAEQIKALKAAHTIEATPERAGKRRIAAEEPVTARIRRRAETISATGPESNPLASEAPANPGPLMPPAGSNNDNSTLHHDRFHPERTNQECVGRGR